MQPLGDSMMMGASPASTPAEAVRTIPTAGRSARWLTVTGCARRRWYPLAAGVDVSGASPLRRCGRLGAEILLEYVPSQSTFCNAAPASRARVEANGNAGVHAAQRVRIGDGLRSDGEDG